MANSLLRTDKEIVDIYERHVKTVYRVCFAYMKNTADTEEILQETFVKLIRQNCVFENIGHEKAWLIRTASNLCKDALRHWWRKRENLADYENLQGEQSFEIDETFAVIMGLPDKYKTVIYMYYYEGYTSVEISKILRKPQSTIRNHIHEARELLRKRLGGDFHNEE
jgi:RNA polymerase sigma-70 factor (ECF subfamily)